MHRLSPRSRAVALPLALAVLAVSACTPGQAPAPTVPAAATARRATATVRASTAAFDALLAKRRVLAGGFRAADLIVSARLVATGADMASQAGVPIAYTPSADRATAPGALTLTVPAGLNRAVTLEALDAEGHVIASLMTVASIDSGTALDLRFDPVTDASGRTLAELIAVPEMASTLASTDLTAGLLAFVDDVVGYNAADNTYSGVNPLAFNRAYLVAQLRQAGPSVLEAAPAEAMRQEAPSNAYVHLVAQDGTTPLVIERSQLATVRVDIFDPYSETLLSASSHPEVNDIAIPRVMPGVWDVRITDALEPGVMWGKLQVDSTGHALMQVSPTVRAANDTSTSLFKEVAVAANADGDAVLVAWPVASGTETLVTGQFRDADGAELTAPFTIGVQEANFGCSIYEAPAMAAAYNAATDHYVVAWAADVTEEDVVAQVLDGSGQLVGSPIDLSTGTGGDFAISATANSDTGDFMLALNDATKVHATLLRQADGGYTPAAASDLSAGEVSGRAALAYNRHSHRYVAALPNAVGTSIVALQLDARGDVVASAEMTPPGSTTGVDAPFAAANPDDGTTLIGWLAPGALGESRTVQARELTGIGTPSGAAPIAITDGYVYDGKPAAAYQPARDGRPGRYLVAYPHWDGTARLRGLTAGLAFDNRGDAAIGAVTTEPLAVVPVADAGFAVYWGSAGAKRVRVP